MHMRVGAWGSPSYLIPLELELQAFVSCLNWLLGSELGSSARAELSLQCWPTSPAPLPIHPFWYSSLKTLPVSSSWHKKWEFGAIAWDDKGKGVGGGNKGRSREIGVPMGENENPLSAAFTDCYMSSLELWEMWGDCCFLPVWGTWLGGSGHSSPTQISFPHHLVLRGSRLSAKRFGIEAAYKISNFKYAGGVIWYNWFTRI